MENLKVAIRVRPLSDIELRKGHQQCLQLATRDSKVILEKKNLKYDFVFGSQESLEVLYKQAISGLTEGIFKGLNATVLTYGQVGSGKTFTMTGSDCEKNPGVIPMVMRNLIKHIKEREESAGFALKCSFLELHNDKIIDLLASEQNRAPLALREDANGELKILGLLEIPVKDVEDMFNVLKKGSAGRAAASTGRNATSSRSHAFFSIYVEKTSKDESIPSFHAQFRFVDLAGEAIHTETKGDRFKEGCSINSNLLALQRVVNSFLTNTRPPYRDFKLTRLLQDSLGGNSQTVMIACVNPTASDMGETLNTLKYAKRARKIKNKPVFNQVKQLAPVNPASEIADSATMTELLERNKKLEDENQKLAGKLEVLLNQNTELSKKAILNPLNQEPNEEACEQELAMEMANQSDEEIEMMKLQYEANIKTLEGQIEALQKEKDTLQVSLQDKSLPDTWKKQRCQTLKDLETSISDLNKVSLLKARSDMTINKLNKDIQSLKRARMKLMQQMKEDTEERQGKMAKDEHGKRQHESTKLERKYEKQHKVNKRKMEEVAAADKSLKEAMARHKAHSRRKPEPQGVHHFEGMDESIKNLIERELDVLVSVNEAKRHLASLLADRKTISQELLDLQQEAEPPKKKRVTSGKSLAVFNTEMQQQIETLQQELDMRNVQITDLQQKIMDANQDEQNRKCWQNITSMAESKSGLKCLIYAEELQDQLREAKKEIAELKKQISKGLKISVATSCEGLKANVKKEKTVRFTEEEFFQSVKEFLSPTDDKKEDQDVEWRPKRRRPNLPKKCGCKKQYCDTKLCGCRARKVSCKIACKCNKAICKNQR